MKTFKTLLRPTHLLLTLCCSLSLVNPVWAGSKADDYFQLGNIFAQNKDYSKAIESYLQAATADPDKYAVRANISIAIVMAQKKDYQKSAKILEAILKDHANYPEIWLVYKIYGKVLVDLKRPQDAIAAFETFLSKVPPDKIKAKEKEDINKQIETLRKQVAG